MAQTISPTPTETIAANPATEPALVFNGTTSAKEAVVSEAKPEQTAPNEETFTSIDVKSLPPELKGKYDAMLTDYKKKTTEAAQNRKQAEEIQRQVQEVIQSPEFQQAYSNLTIKQQSQVKDDMNISDEEFNKAFENKDNFAGFIKKVAKVSTASSQQEIINLKASLAIKDFKSAHPEFDVINKHGFITYQLKNDPRAQGHDSSQWQAALNDAYSNAIRVRDELIEEGKRSGLEVIQKKMQASTEPPTASVSQVYPGGDPKKITTAEALDMARRGIRVPMT